MDSEHVKDAPDRARRSKHKAKATNSPRKSPYFASCNQNYSQARKRKAMAGLSQNPSSVGEPPGFSRTTKRRKHNQSGVNRQVQAGSDDPKAPSDSSGSEAKLTKLSKSGQARTEEQKTRRREVTAKKRAVQVDATQPNSITKTRSPRKIKSIDGDANALAKDQQCSKACTTSPVPGGGKETRTGELVSMTAAVEAVSTACEALSCILDQSLSSAVAAARPRAPPSKEHSTSTSKISKFERIPRQESRIGSTESAIAHGSQPSDELITVSPDTGKTKLKISKSIKVSPHFDPSPTKRPPPTSCVPFPPLSSTRFGLVQETLSHSPFGLLLACIFLNKTRGAVALPVFYDLMTRYPTPSALAAAEHQEVVRIIQHLGLQNQRAHTCINIAKAWLVQEPVMGKRRRVLNYPCRGDGRDVKADEVIDDGDKRVAWEVGQLPGVGAYAIDSWRIFCRDELRGRPTGMPDEVTEKTKEEEMQKEWTRVLPSDKELRAYLRWRWLRNGIIWNPLSGEKQPASEEVLQKAREGGVMYEGGDVDGTV